MSDHIEFAVLISTDRDHFLRLTCPSCGRDFKIEINQADLRGALSSYCQRMGLDVLGQASDKGAAARIGCPYCGYEGEGAKMHTEETMRYLKRIISREYVGPTINRLTSAMGESFGSRRQSGGFLSLSVEFKQSRAVLGPRPIHGPEPGDFKIVEFLCCGKRIKVSEAWTGLRVCSFCGTEVVLT
jgi:hypothetical protein